MQKIENCNLILSDDGETVTINVETDGGTTAVYFPIGGNRSAVQMYFDRHGEER